MEPQGGPPGTAALAAAADGLAIPQLGAVPSTLHRAECPGASERLAAGMIAAGLADPRQLSAETPTDTFVAGALEHWARQVITHADLPGGVSLECRVGLDSYSKEPRLSLALHVHSYFEWHLGPFLDGLAARSPVAARTLLAIIEQVLTSEVYGPLRAAEQLEYMAEVEEELRDDEEEGDGELAEERAARQPPEPSFQKLRGVTPLPRNRILSGLRPHLAPDVHGTVAALLQAERNRRRIRYQGLSDEAEGTAPALYCLFATRGDSTTTAFDEEAQGWSDDVGPTYDFVTSAVDTRGVRQVFGAMARTLAVLDVLHTLRGLTAADLPADDP